MKETIFITGGDGFLGKILTSKLENMNHTVHTFDLTNGEDILNIDQLFQKLQKSGAKKLIHLAAIADLYIMKNNPETSNKVNIQGTQNVIHVCDQLGVTCYFSSTCCCYGNHHSIEPSHEESPLNPTEIYAISKMKGEEIIKKGKSFCILRLATFYGPTMRSSIVQSVFLRAVMENKDLQIHGDGKQTRTYTHVEDIASGIIIVVLNEKVIPVVNISVDKSYSVLEVAEFAQKIVGNKVNMIHGKDREGQIFREEIDNTLLKSLGWKPKFDLFEGMMDTFEGLKRYSKWEINMINMDVRFY
jgi:UDP-glucose 4-epimerase